MKALANESVDLVVTSPPYPMIEMWDESFALQSSEVQKKLTHGLGNEAFELMHLELDKVWAEVVRVLKNGSFACINIGDATRTIGGEFNLFANHSRIIQAFLKLGMVNLPNIIWRKQTNAPNKFMGSGMLPAGAYVTLEHEWILIFRKGGKRIFATEQEKLNRRESAFFWEERNKWFSDVWDFKGVKQSLGNANLRQKSAAFPFELPYRLINMYSIQGDIILDPFLGTGTTSQAAIASRRNSLGFEIDKDLHAYAKTNIQDTPKTELNSIIAKRLAEHKQFIANRVETEGKQEIKYFNTHIGLPVITAQEQDLKLWFVDSVSTKKGQMIEASYSATPSYEKEIVVRNGQRSVIQTAMQF